MNRITEANVILNIDDVVRMIRGIDVPNNHDFNFINKYSKFGESNYGSWYWYRNPGCIQFYSATELFKIYKEILRDIENMGKD